MKWVGATVCFFFGVVTLMFSILFWPLAVFGFGWVIIGVTVACIPTSPVIVYRAYPVYVRLSTYDPMRQLPYGPRR